MAGIAEDWKLYTIRDKILLCSSILPLFISVLYMLKYLPILGVLIFDEIGLGKYLFFNSETGESKLFDTYDLESHILHIIRPIWLLLSFLSLGLYGFILSKSDEEVNELLKQMPGTAVNPGHSALFRTSTFMSVTAASQLLIFFCLLIFGFLVEIIWEYYWVDASSRNRHRCCR